MSFFIDQLSNAFLMDLDPCLTENQVLCNYIIIIIQLKYIN